eukprot:TRINITY_DN11687_c0_g1_i1.p1 TRINITY_DN11687_c0_g1~~TRINITY_DN11687_c0_g1_i1.p1  ORF type:complete len:238 (-),score=24.52 TRINITY_DN11687_c0_g1_i1:231-944(-)
MQAAPYSPGGCWNPQAGSAPWAFVPTGSSAPPPSRPNTLVGIVCNNFEKLWDNNNMKKRMKSQISFYRVEPPDGYFRLGDFIEQSHSPYPGASMLVIKESNPEGGFPLLVKPIRYAKIWDDRGTGAKFGDLSVFRPVAPAGYVALGDVCMRSQSQEPSIDYMRCVHSSMVVQGEWTAEAVWHDKGAGAKFGDLSLWAPHPTAEVGGSNIRTFVSSGNYNRPQDRPAWVLIGPRGHGH